MCSNYEKKRPKPETCGDCLYLKECFASWKIGVHGGQHVVDALRCDRLPDPRPLPGTEQPERKVYTRSEVSTIIRFLLELSPAEFMMLKLRLLHRDASPLEIAGWLKQPPGKVFQLFNDMRKKYPVLAGVLSFRYKDKFK